MKETKPKTNIKSHYTKKEIAAEYGISVRTFYRRLQKAGVELDRTLITHKKLQEIIKKLDWDQA